MEYPLHSLKGAELKPQKELGTLFSIKSMKVPNHVDFLKATVPLTFWPQ